MVSNEFAPNLHVPVSCKEAAFPYPRLAINLYTCLIGDQWALQIHDCTGAAVANHLVNHHHFYDNYGWARLRTCKSPMPLVDRKDQTPSSTVACEVDPGSLPSRLR